MVDNIEHVFPAGDESDGSNDEWDIGYTSGTKNLDSMVSILYPEHNVSVLKRAITAGNIDLVRQLLDSGMDVETRLIFDWTPLMCAVHTGHCELAELLLNRGASANFSKDHYTVLMAACTANSVTQENINKCVALLLSRNADPNVYNRSRMTSLMLAARNGYSQVINLLVSHGADLDLQDDSGHTALMLAVQYGHEAAVLKLLQLGANKSINSKSGKTAADLAKSFKHLQIYRILSSSSDSIVDGVLPSKAATVVKFLNRNPEPVSGSKESSTKLDDIDLLLHGLKLEYLCSIMVIGITDPEDQKKLLNAIQEIQIDRMDLDTLLQLDNIDSGNEELYNFLVSLRQQCRYLTETVQDVISRLPCSTSQLVLSLDPKKEAQAISTELVAQIGDLQKEVLCLKELLGKVDPTDYTFHPLLPSSHRGTRGRVVKKVAMAVLGAVLLLLLSQARH